MAQSKAKLKAILTMHSLHGSWNDKTNNEDEWMIHHNTVVSLLRNHNEVMDVMDLLCLDEDIPLIMIFVNDLRNMYVNTGMWDSGQSAFLRWKTLMVRHQVPTDAELAQRLFQDMLVVLLNRLEHRFNFDAPHYKEHKLRAPFPTALAEMFCRGLVANPF